MTGCGAGLLNGETAKVSMSVIPPERGGMASGISGTLRFVGVVTGLTGLGVVLASQTEKPSFVRRAVGFAPIGCIERRASDRREDRRWRYFGRGRTNARACFERQLQNWRARVSRPGSRSVLLAAGVAAALAAALTFAFISPAETAPVAHASRRRDGAPELLD